MHTSILRQAQAPLQRDLAQFPAVAILGPRQCGKTTLAKQCLAGKPHIYLDLELPSDRQKLAHPEQFLGAYADQTVCLDEIQRVPELFPVLRGLIDQHRRPGRFLVLGSASPALLRQSSESLAGRIAHLELAPLHRIEVPAIARETHWLRGGFPDSLLAADEETSCRWRKNYIRTFLEQDIPQMGFRVPSSTLGRFWQMAAHLHGQTLNLSLLGRSLDTHHASVRHYADMLAQTYMLRLLPPFEGNLGKRLVKSPKMYLRDSGLLHALLDIRNREDLFAHAAFGASWEGFVVEQILCALPDVRATWYRTSTGNELDLILERGNRRFAVECKAGLAPQVTKGFWMALEDLRVEQALVVAPVAQGCPLAKNAAVTSLEEAIGVLRAALG